MVSNRSSAANSAMMLAQMSGVVRADGAQPDADAVSGGGPGMRGERIVRTGQAGRAVGKP
jgi:hypothetical protein